MGTSWPRRSGLPVPVAKWPQVFNLRFPVAQVCNLRCRRRSGLPVPVAGRSRMPSWHPLSACPLRFGILPTLAPRARLSGTGSPELAMFWFTARSVATRCIPL